jgi:type IV pilus assembly protein PilO
MAISSDSRSPLLLLVLAGIVGYIAYSGSVIDQVGMTGLQAGRERITAVRDTIRQLEAQTDSAKQELATGTVDDLRKRLDTYRASLGLLRRLVPDRNEVPNLLDDISTRARIRGVNLAGVTPLPVEAGPVPFDTYRYQMSVIGHYDQIGEFLADVATLQRIIVPLDVTMAAANATAAKALGDSTGALLEAKFLIRTFVKSNSAEGEGSGT